MAEWNSTVLAEDTFLSVVTLRELRTGALLVDRRDPVAGASLLGWVDRVSKSYRRRLIAIDGPIAEACAALHVPDPMPAEDARIAATASIHGLTVVTRNTADFTRVDVPVTNPWRTA